MIILRCVLLCPAKKKKKDTGELMPVAALIDCLKPRDQLEDLQGFRPREGFFEKKKKTLRYILIRQLSAVFVFLRNLAGSNRDDSIFYLRTLEIIYVR